MVFDQLSPNEKNAFFGLLDEYFASRPDFFKNASSSSSASLDSSSGGGGVVEKAAASAVRKAFASPAGRSAAQEAVSKNFGSGVAAATSAAANTGWNGKREASPAPGQSANDEQSSTPSFGSGRVAAAAAALKASPRFSGGGSSPGGPPRPPPGRTSNNNAEASVDDAPAPPSRPGSFNKLAQSFGDVDSSAAKNVFGSLRQPAVNKPPQAPGSGPPPFVKSNPFSQAPSRSGPSPSAAALMAATSGAHRAASTPPPPPPPPPPPRLRAQEEGDWAEVLYDYSSEDPGDLEIKENQRVLIVEKSSDDWWTGELNGKRGLVPAAYVKLV